MNNYNIDWIAHTSKYGRIRLGTGLCHAVVHCLCIHKGSKSKGLNPYHTHSVTNKRRKVASYMNRQRLS